jgi:hypothetical protein
MTMTWWSRAVLVVLVLVLAGCQGATRERNSANDPARIRGVDREPTGDLTDACALLSANPHWSTALKAADTKWGAEPHVVMAIIWQESRFQARARNPNSTAFGYPQAINATWAWYQEANSRSGARRTNFADSVDFIGWYASRTEKVNGVSMSDTFSHYIAYHEGHGGFSNGGWRRKSALVQIARRVEGMAETYEGQLRRCL